MSTAHTTSPLKAGFTLIELLVSVTITLLMVGGGIAAFVTFNDRQILQNAGREVQTALRSAQVKARAGDRPAGCTKLLSHAVRISPGSSLVRVQAVCEDDDYDVAEYQLHESVISSDEVDMRFLVLHGGVTNAGTITLAKDTSSISIIVNEGGEITTVIN